MLSDETRLVLANLDWLIIHESCKLDFAAGVVFNENGEPAYTLEDLATAGLTPATKMPMLLLLDPVLLAPDFLVGKEIRIKMTRAVNDCRRMP